MGPKLAAMPNHNQLITHTYLCMGIGARVMMQTCIVSENNHRVSAVQQLDQLCTAPVTCKGFLATLFTTA